MSALPGVATLGDRLLDEPGVARALRRLAHELREHHSDLSEVVLAGVLTRGLPLALRLAALLDELTGSSPAVASLDLRGYRDDRPRPEQRPGALGAVNGGPLPPIAGRTVVVVDDVLYTGRTVRAALDALSQAGRAASVEVLVLVDRGHRELPLRATYVGKNVPTASRQRVAVRMLECDGVEGVWLVAAR
ncbi:MAG: bifunctional pyr operon transcriptional regulator/uracil phosphoribosyltransferase PyrR [Candidatus Dormibacteria bacterium]